MAPSSPLQHASSELLRRLPVEKPTEPKALVLEAWAQGYLVGSLIIMAAITIANMRRKVLLHKLILLELFLGAFHGTFIFNSPPVYGWYLSATAILLNISWSLHNVIAWMKTKPFLSKRWSYFYIGTVILAQPYWIVEIYANFTYFNNINKVFIKTRPYEAIFRDPWWIFSVINLYWNLVRSYHLSIHTIVYISPRFGVLLVSMFLSLCFIITDVCAVTGVFDSLLPDGLNPFWKLAMVFKCLCDSIVLDDFKTALDRLKRYKLWRERLGGDCGPLGPTAGTADDIREEEERMKIELDPLGEDAAERGKSVATILEQRHQLQLQQTAASAAAASAAADIEAAFAKSRPHVVSSFDEVDLPEHMSGSGSSALKSASDSSSTALWGRTSWGKESDIYPNSSKRPSLVPG